MHYSMPWGHELTQVHVYVNYCTYMYMYSVGNRESGEVPFWIFAHLEKGRGGDKCDGREEGLSTGKNIPSHTVVMVEDGGQAGD